MHGFYNNGNTCYFNSAIQCLISVKNMSEHILSTDYNGECKFTMMYRELIKLYYKENKSLKINIFPLLKAFHVAFPRFGTPQPHDAQDAIFCILDILEVSYPYVKTLFYGEREQETIYPGGKKVFKEPFSMLLLYGKDKESVNALIHDNDKWHILIDYIDDDGKKHHVASTRTSIIKYPPVLFVSFDKKVRVIADEILNNYEVSGSIIHIGNQHGGHYISICKLNDKWILQDDNNIKLVEFPNEQYHHVLMYTLKTLPS